MRTKIHCMILLLILLLSAGTKLTAAPQRTGIPQRSQQEQVPDEQELKHQRDLAKKQNQDRHEAVKRDTDKLLQLATELKEYVDKSNENLLSVDVIRKSEEIEKLAHSVREKMKGF